MNLRNIIATLSAVLSALTAWGGQPVVPAEISESAEFRLVSGFLNRYAAMLASHTQDTADSLRRIKEDGFRYTRGDDTRLKNLSGDEDFAVSFSDGRYTAAWSDAGKTLVECVVPANIGLLTFSNKIELEEAMIQRLLNPGDSEPRNLPAEHRESLDKIVGSEYYVKDRGYYITPRLKNQIIYAPCPDDTTGICQLLIDTERYKLESVANMLISGYAPQPVETTVKVRQYGYKSQTVNIPFPELYAILSADDSTPYWGVETFDGTTVKGLYLWTNKYGGYNHMLTVTIPVTVLSEPSSIDATLHCYIRTDNLKSLFNEYPEL